ELVNHLGIRLGSDPAHILDKIQRGHWNEEDVTPPPEDSFDTEYSDHVREIVDSPARYNSNQKFVYGASGSAGKVVIFAARTRTLPKPKDATTFYIGTNLPSELEIIRRAILTSDRPLPISGEYIGRKAFDLAATYGKDTFVAIKHAGSRQLVRL